MSAAHADRNLLYGLLALQMDFLRRDEFIEALQLWALDKDKPLERIVQERGWLSPEDHAVLEPLLRRHLQRHGGSVERSLAAVSVPAEVHLDLRSLSDEKIEASLGCLKTPAATPLPETLDVPPSESPAATVTHPGTSLGDPPQRYQLVRPHARGGLGEVHVALDTELNREVALKRILESRVEGDSDRRRFVFEAEVTGGLEHPGIVPIYSLGHDPRTGRPFYAMRFIRGDSLKDAIAAYHSDEAKRAEPSERSLQLRRLLSQLIDGCNAIAYAHDRGVLHRDIKPANIMVGKYGETLVVDWGLAKVVGRIDEPAGARDEATLRPPSGSGLQETLPGSALGTPQYMPPEQAEGRHDVIGLASDVYSLGATLYTILVGRPPFVAQAVPEILAAVRRGDFEAPRTVDPRIPRGLEAICLKAMALRPGDRYPTATALAEDLEHWLADEPIAARPDPRLVRLGRWVRRHKTLVAGIAGLLLATTIGLAVGTVLLGQANRQIRAQKRQVTVNFELAERRRIEAQENYVRAERNYELAREAVDQFYTRVSENMLLNQPHMEPLRRELLESARAYYERFTNRRADDPRSRSDLGWALLRLSRIDRDLGSTSKAIAHADRARALFAELTDGYPENPEYRRYLAASFNDLGGLSLDLGRLEEADALYRAALELRRRLADEHPEVASYQRDLAASYNDLGMRYSGRLYGAGNTAEAEAAYHRALDIYQRLVDENPEVTAIDQHLAATLMNLATLYSGVGRMEDSEAMFKRAIELEDRLASEYPEVIEYQSAVATSYNNLGIHYGAAGRTEDAEAMFKRAMEFRERLVEQHTELIEVRVGLGGTYCNLGVLYRNSPEPGPALRWFDRAETTLQSALDREPRHDKARAFLYNTVRGRASTLDRLGRHGEAAEDWGRAARLDEGRWHDYYLWNRARSLALAGDHIAAESAAATLADNAASSTRDRYNAACVFALAARAARAANAKESADALADRALAQLERARELGYFEDPDHISRIDQDPDLEPLRNEAAYRAFRLDLGFPADPFARGEQPVE